MLPVDLLRKIAEVSPAAYRAMLALPLFARSLDPGIIADYKILFGHTVTVTRNGIVWRRRGRIHRLDGPAVEWNGSKYWYRGHWLHRDGCSAIEHADGRAEWYIHGLYQWWPPR